MLKQSGDRWQKTIVLCMDAEHSARMRQDLSDENPIVGRSTRVHVDTLKYYFTSIDPHKPPQHFTERRAAVE